MLKKSDYVAMMLAFFALLLFYLTFAGSLSVNLGISNPLETLELPKDFSTIRESNEEEPAFAVICGSQKESESTNNMIQMLSNLKKEYAVFSTVDQISEAQAKTITTIIITAKSWDEIGDKELLLQYAGELGKNLIFTQVLEEEEDGQCNKIIGIQENKGITEIEGIMVFEGMFIQGMVYYDDIKAEVYDITADARCKKLMVERREEPVEQRDLIPLIWEKRYGEGTFYVVNGNFLAEDSSMGIFTGMLSQMEDTFIYPVINAKASLLDSFPELSNPYEDVIEELYSRSTDMFLRDIVWPSIVKLGESDTLVFSARLNTPVAESQKENYQYLEGLMKKRGYEIDDSFTGQELEIPYISSGHKREEEEIFKMQSSISGWGLATHYLDISEVMGKNGDNPEYEWSAYSLELSKLMYDLYKDTDWMDAMTVSQALERYKRYLLINPVITKSNRKITIKTENFHDLCFYMIQTERTVLPGDGYEVEKVGDNAYLIKVLQENITIGLKEEQE